MVTADVLRVHMHTVMKMLMVTVVVGVTQAHVRAARTVASAHMRPLQVRGLLSVATIERACDSDMFTAAQLQYMRSSRDSVDARDVAWHRAVTRLVNAHAPERVANNEIMHQLDYDARRAGVCE